MADASKIDRTGAQRRPAQDIRALSRQFDFEGTFVRADPFGNGHINDTWRVTMGQSTRLAHYTLQRINSHVFHDPPAMMNNVGRVSSHLLDKLKGCSDAERRALRPIPARDGQLLHVDPAGQYWRAYAFIEGARACPVAQSPAQAYQAARAFGRFQRLLADLPGPRLHETIPDFHNTPARFAALERAVETDPVNRARLAAGEIEFALKHKRITSVLLDARLPERATHNDTKLSNVLLDEVTDEGLCVIDLDTVMPGLAVYDFGDMVRSATSPAAEDERDLSRVTMRLPVYESLLRGYLDEMAEVLTSAERTHLAISGKLITFETGLRFLTDFLQGDTYFKTERVGQNLDRCRVQFKLVESIEDQVETMTRLADDLLGR